MVVAGGATSTPGAVLLAGLAALRAGAGRLTVLTVDTTSVPVGVALPEAMVLGLPADERGSVSPDAADELLSACERAGAVVLGPGLLGAAGAGELLARVLPRLTAHVLVLLDAVALTAVGERPELLDPVRGRVLLTPNSGELAALTDGGQEGPEAAVCVAAHHGAVVATRGWVAAPDGSLWHDVAGGVGLGTRGPATCSPARSAACWPAERNPRRPRCGVSTCTRSAATGSAAGAAPWASWPASCSNRSRPPWPTCAPESPAQQHEHQDRERDGRERERPAWPLVVRPAAVQQAGQQQAAPERHHQREDDRAAGRPTPAAAWRRPPAAV